MSRKQSIHFAILKILFSLFTWFEFIWAVAALDGLYSAAAKAAMLRLQVAPLRYAPVAVAQHSLPALRGTATITTARAAAKDWY